LRQLLQCGMMTPVLTNGEAAENMAIAAGKGPNAQKIGLKEQALALVQRISAARRRKLRLGVTAARRRARGGDCAASQPRVLAARSCDQPIRRGAGGRRPKLLRRPPIRPRLRPMIRVKISVEAFEAIAATLKLDSVGYENKIDEHGQRLIWLDRGVVERLRSLRPR
jgi:hypothetical protein